MVICNLKRVNFRHRSADFDRGDGDPPVPADPRDARGVLPVHRVRQQRGGGDRPRTHRRAHAVPQLQHQPRLHAHPQPLPVQRQADGQVAGVAR